MHCIGTAERKVELPLAHRSHPAIITSKCQKLLEVDIQPYTAFISQGFGNENVIFVNSRHAITNSVTLSGVTKTRTTLSGYPRAESNDGTRGGVGTDLSCGAVALGLRSRPQSSDLSRIRRNIVEDVRFV